MAAKSLGGSRARIGAREFEAHLVVEVSHVWPEPPSPALPLWSSLASTIRSTVAGMPPGSEAVRPEVRAYSCNSWVSSRDGGGEVGSCGVTTTVLTP